MIKLVLFDMDDVLCAYDWAGRVEALAGRAGRPAAELKASIWESGFEDAADRGELSAEAYLDGFAERLGIAFTRQDWIANRKAAMTPWLDMLALAATAATRCQIAVLSNNGHLTADSIDELFPALRPIFGDNILMSATLGLQKPDPAIYRAALARFGTAPEETLFTDDLAGNVAGAAAAGLHGHVHAGPEALQRTFARLAIS